MVLFVLSTECLNRRNKFDQLSVKVKECPVNSNGLPVDKDGNLRFKYPDPIIINPNVLVVWVHPKID